MTFISKARQFPTNNTKIRKRAPAFKGTCTIRIHQTANNFQIPIVCVKYECLYVFLVQHIIHLLAVAGCSLGHWVATGN